MSFPKYNNTSVIERLGVNAVAEAVARLGLIWRETPMADVGIDGQIEYVAPEGYATGRILAVQIKSGNSFFKESGNNWPFYPEEKHRFYWERFPVPVLLILHNPDTGLSYWQDIRQALRAEAKTGAKALLIPKENVLQQTSAQSIFESFAVSEEPYLEVDEVLKALIQQESKNACFPVSHFNLFCTGLTNIARSLYFGMDMAIEIAEYKLAIANSPFGVGVGDNEHNFLFSYTKFLVRQHIADIDFSACMSDWYDRQMQPSFMAPLTSRGRELVKLIHEIEGKYKTERSLPDTGLLRAAQEGFVRLLFTPTEFERIGLVDSFRRVYLEKLAAN